MIGRDRSSVVGDVGDQSVEAGRPEIAEMISAGAPVTAMICGEGEEPGAVESHGEPVVAGAVLGEAVGDLDDAARITVDVDPGIGRDVDAIGGRDERGLLNGHGSIITQPARIRQTARVPASRRVR